MALENYLTSLWCDWNGNGQPGLKARMCTFMDQFEAVEEDREKNQELRHTENSQKMEQIANATAQSSNATAQAGNAIQRLILLVMFLALLVTILLGVVGFIEAKRANLIPPHIFPPDVTRQVYADDNALPQSATIPYHSY